MISFKEGRVLKLNNKVFDYLKWITIILIPAATTLYVTLAPVWNLPCAEEVSKTSMAIVTFLGAILGISTISYIKSENEDDEEDEDDEDEEWPDEEGDE